MRAGALSPAAQQRAAVLDDDLAQPLGWIRECSRFT
jgi:hypothetical protein